MTSTGKETIREQSTLLKSTPGRFFHHGIHAKPEEKIMRIEGRIAKLEKEKDENLRHVEEAEKRRFGHPIFRRSVAEKEETIRANEVEKEEGRVHHHIGHKKLEQENRRSESNNSQDSSSGFMSRFHRNHVAFASPSSDSFSLLGSYQTSTPNNLEEGGESFSVSPNEILSRQSSSFEDRFPIQSHLMNEERMSVGSETHLSADASSDEERTYSPVPSFIYEGPTRIYGEHPRMVDSAETSEMYSSIPSITSKNKFHESCFMDTLILPPILPGENEAQSETNLFRLGSSASNQAITTPPIQKYVMSAPDVKATLTTQKSQLSQSAPNRIGQGWDEENLHSSVKKKQEFGWCSWCAHYGPQNLMIFNRYGRNDYNCDDCCRNTSKCFKCKDGYAKLYGSGYGEKLVSMCAVCDGTFQSWDTATPPCIEGWCSWCFNKSKHALYKKNRIQKNVYQCGQCNRHTSPCKCKEAFAKARGENAGGQCAKCKRKIKEWSNREENLNLVSREGWCSWCFEKTRHETDKDSKIKRTIYTCRQCRLRTLRCYSCDIGMTKGGYVWDDHLCASCAIGRKVVWEDIKKKKDQVIARPRNINKVIEDLKRDSEYKQKALKVGCIRPFLIMVAMAPMFRFQIASCLGWTLFTEPYFGDSHAEAWHILDRYQFGMRFRTSSSYEKINVFGLHSTWYDMLIRTADVGFKYQLPDKLVKGNRKQRKCQDSKDLFIPKIEEEFLAMLAHLMRSQMSAEERAEQTRSALKDSSEYIQRKIYENTGITRKDIGSYGYNVANNIQQTLGVASSVKSVVLQQAASHILQATSATGAIVPPNIAAAAAVATAANTAGTSAGVWVPQVLSVAVPQMAGVLGSVATVAAQMALLSTPLFFLGFLGLAKTGFELIFGSSEGRLFVPVTIILNQRLLLAIEGIKIEDYY